MAVHERRTGGEVELRVLFCELPSRLFGEYLGPEVSVERVVVTTDEVLARGLTVAYLLL